jgi:hypothetical protein
LPLGGCDGGFAAHISFVSGTAIAVAPCADGAATATINCAVTAADDVTLTITGAFGHVTPGGSIAAAGQLIITAPVNPLTGVTVIVELPVIPAVTAAVVEEVLKPGGMIVTMVMAELFT